MKNIVLIGMPSAGKSTMGVLLAKILGMNFVDTDIIIQEKTGKLLQEIIDEKGIEYFLSVEEKSIIEYTFTNSVIATGGSVVYSFNAMEELKENGIVVYLKIEFQDMVNRINNITTRGIVIEQEKSLQDMYSEREPLYERYADITVDCSTGSIENKLDTLVCSIRNQHME